MGKISVEQSAFSSGHVKLLDLIRAARKDNLAAMELLPVGADISTVGRLPFVVAQSHASAHHVLVADAESYRKPSIVRNVIIDGLGENLFTADGDRWLAKRKPIAPVFGLDNLDALAELMLDTVEQVAGRWQPGEIDIQAAMTDLTMEVALRGLIGVGDDTEQLADDVRSSFEEILAWITNSFNNPASPRARVPTARNRRLAEAKSSLREAVRSIINSRRREGAESFDILSQLLRAQSKGTELSDDDIIEECIGFLFAGHETTATTLTWALYELSLRPELQAALRDEGTRLAHPESGLVAELGSLTQTDAVMRETLRMYPSGIAIVRSAKRGTQLAGRKIRRGTLVMIPVYAIQRSADYWDDPNDFEPSRPQADDGAGYLPFGLGPRRCLGARFARTEMLIALARICSRWELRYDQPEPPRPITAPSLRAEGELLVRLNPLPSVDG